MLETKEKRNSGLNRGLLFNDGRNNGRRVEA